MSEDECLKLLATDGMLVKHPLLVGDGFVLVWFKEDEWNNLCNHNFKGIIWTIKILQRI